MKFQHPVDRGTVARGAETWPIEDGVVDLPEDLGRELQLRPADEPAPEPPAQAVRFGKKTR